MATSSYLYPYDPTGVASSNLIVAENHTVQPPNNISDASFVIPRAAPFFGDSVIVRTGPTNASLRLEEGIDYYLTHSFVTLSYTLSRSLYGSITLVNRGYTGEIYITYQTVGGEYVLDSYSIIEERTRSLYNVYMVTWEQVSGNYPQLPAYDHKMAGDDLVGFGKVIDAIQLLSAAIAAGGTGGGSGTGGSGDGGFAALLAHMNANTSHTKEQVGLGNVDNYKTANEADVVALSTRTFMTPAMAKYYLENTVFVSQLNVARQDITALGDRARLLESANTTTTTQITEISTTLNNLAGSMDDIRESMDDLADDVAASLAPFEGVPARVTVLETAMIDVKNRVGVLETRRTAVDLILTDLTDRIVALETAPAPVLVSPVLSRIYGQSEIEYSNPLIKVPAGRVALLTVLGSVKKTNTVPKGYVYSVADSNGVIRSTEDLSTFIPLLTVNGIVQSPIIEDAPPIVAGATNSFRWHTSLSTAIVEISVNGGAWTSIGETLPEGLSFTIQPTSPGAQSTLSYSGTGQINVSVRTDGADAASLYVNPVAGENEVDQSNTSWKLYNATGDEIDVSLTENRQYPPAFGDMTDTDEDYGVSFRRVDVTLGEPPTVAEEDIIGYAYTAGSVVVRSGVTFANKTKTNGRVPDPLTVNLGDPIARLDDVTINTVKYPVSYDTVYTESTTQGVPTTGYGQLTISNTGTADVYLLLAGELSLVAVTDNTEVSDNLINVTFPV